MKVDLTKSLSARAFAILLAGMTLFPACTPEFPTVSPSIVAMSFNIRFDNPADGDNAWPHRKEKVAGTIAFFGADIAGLQEALAGQISDLETLLPEYAWLGVGRDDGKARGEFCPVFYRRSRFVPVHHGTFWLSENPEIPGSRSWDAAICRIVSWVEFRDLATGAIFTVLNTHFDHIGETAREESARLLLEWIHTLDTRRPVILLGDFNCAEDDVPMAILTSNTNGFPPFVDTRSLSIALPYGSTGTFNGFMETMGPGKRIDHILVRNAVSVERWGVIADRWDGRFVSDHNLVLAEIVFEGKRRP
jgi:endonuclease/exonuclease/phosphatase family metal-dependent hydrolase